MIKRKRKTNPILVFLKPLSFDAIYDFKKLDFDLILEDKSGF